MNLDSLLKETADKMVKMPAKVLGDVFHAHAKYIEKKEGKEGLRRLSQKMKELGYPVEFDKIKSFEYYPIGTADLIIVVSKEIFGWTDKDVFEMGNASPKTEFITRLLLKYFVNIKMLAKEAPNYWKKHVTAGEVECKLDEKKKKVIVRVKFSFSHPLICIYFGGYFARIAQFGIKNAKPTIKETKCMFKGDPYHEYLIEW